MVPGAPGVEQHDPLCSEILSGDNAIASLPGHVAPTLNGIHHNENLVIHFNLRQYAGRKIFIHKEGC